MKKRYLSILLALALCLALTVAALANGETDDIAEVEAFETIAAENVPLITAAIHYGAETPTTSSKAAALLKKGSAFDAAALLRELVGLGQK